MMPFSTNCVSRSTLYLRAPSSVAPHRFCHALLTAMVQPSGENTWVLKGESSSSAWKRRRSESTASRGTAVPPDASGCSKGCGRPGVRTALGALFEKRATLPSVSTTMITDRPPPAMVIVKPRIRCIVVRPVLAPSVTGMFIAPLYGQKDPLPSRGDDESVFETRVIRDLVAQTQEALRRYYRAGRRFRAAATVQKIVFNSEKKSATVYTMALLRLGALVSCGSNPDGSWTTSRR